MSKTKFKIRIVPFLLSILAASSVYGQANRSTISGFVFDPARRPLAQIIVELRSEYSTAGRVRTDGSGRFYFTGLAHGRYTIRVLPLGTNLMEQTEEVELAGMGSRGQSVPDNVHKDVYLKARRSADSIPFQNAVVFAQDVPKEAEVLYKKAIDDLDSERNQAGIEGLEKAVATFPTYFSALQRLGVVRISQERYDDAADIFTRALAINSRCFDCHYGVSYARYTVRRFPEAVAAADKAVAEKPSSVEAHLLRGMSHRMIKSFEQAEQSLQRAVKLSDGNSSDAHWNLALLYGKDLNRFADAAKELESFLKISPDAPNKEEIKKLIKQFKNQAKGSS
jgi:tetratricopeptide (TPR) repeat protein